MDSCLRRNDGLTYKWIPAFAGMTEFIGMSWFDWIPAFAGIMKRYVRNLIFASLFPEYRILLMLDQL